MQHLDAYIDANTDQAEQTIDRALKCEAEGQDDPLEDHQLDQLSGPG